MWSRWSGGFQSTQHPHDYIVQPAASKQGVALHMDSSVAAIIHRAILSYLAHAVVVAPGALFAAVRLFKKWGYV